MITGPECFNLRYILDGSTANFQICLWHDFKRVFKKYQVAMSKITIDHIIEILPAA